MTIRLDQRSLEKLLDDQPEIFNGRERRKIKRRTPKKAEKISTKGTRPGKHSVIKDGKFVKLH